jgi:hypothetical protein
MDALGSTLCQKVFDRLTAMNRGSVADQQQIAWVLPQEQLQEADYMWAFVSMVLCLRTYPSLRSDATNGREMVTGQFHG